MLCYFQSNDTFFVISKTIFSPKFKSQFTWRCWGSVLIPPLGLLYLCCRLKHKSFMVCFFWVLKMVTVKVVFWCFGNLEHRSLWKIKNAFWSLVSVVQSMMREFLASGMCCLMIVHLKVVLYGNSFFHLEVKLHSRPLYLCCLLFSWQRCLFSFSYLEERPRASLWVWRRPFPITNQLHTLPP